jgi:hypothetical protein
MAVLRPSLAIIAAVVLWLNGCSILLVTPRHGSPSNREPSSSCTVNYLAPVIDSLLVIPPAYRASSALDKSDADYQGAAIPRAADLGLGLGLTALFAASAIYGYLAVSDCRDGYTSRGAPLPE